MEMEAGERPSTLATSWGGMTIETPPTPRALAMSDPILRSGRVPTLTPTPHDPLDLLRTLARRDLSPIERALVEGEIHTWELHRLLRA